MNRYPSCLYPLTGQKRLTAEQAEWAYEMSLWPRETPAVPRPRPFPIPDPLAEEQEMPEA